MKTFVIGDVHGRLWLLKQLIEGAQMDVEHDNIIFLGDLIDRGENSPGVVEFVYMMQAHNPNVITLRGNHEQMLLDFLDYGDLIWLHTSNGGHRTLAQYGSPMSEHDASINLRIPEHHLDFLRSTIMYHEDDYAVYVHGGLTPGHHPSEEDPHVLLWTRSTDFYEHYEGKLCIFGHTPSRFIKVGPPRKPHEVFIGRHAIGIDTGFREQDPLTCLEMQDLVVHQQFPERKVESRQISLLKPNRPALAANTIG